MASILITGASGFIGSFIVEEAINRGLEVWAGVRKSSNRQFLTLPQIHFLSTDFSDPTTLTNDLSEYKSAHGSFDFIVHCAGVTKCIHKEDFEQVNFQQTKILVDALRALNMVPKQFIYLSTLGVFGAIHEQTYLPICEQDTMKPNTAYGLSKYKAEQYIRNLSDFPYVFLRPTGVYGPREKDYYLLAKSIKHHFDFSVGWKHQDLTFVYVKDLVKIIFLCIERHVSRRAYFVTDDHVYSGRQFSDFIQQNLPVRTVIHLKSPLFILKIASFCAEIVSKIAHQSSTLNMDKYKIMKQRNWRCDITLTKEELGYTPTYDLRRGVAETIQWYKTAGWL